MPADPATPCVVFDVDGTLATFDAATLGPLVHGDVKDWDRFHAAMADAKVIAPVGHLLRRLKQAGETIVICSGRPEGWSTETEGWLTRNNLDFDAIYLRPEAQDAASDPEVKRHLLARMRADGYEPWIVIDDRRSVVDTWREAGLICLQCAPGEF
ncbi:phosphatase domain-containing protein [Epibacterium sp. Ofav1-8]|uniref:phosphatase domain-containing protein n=1 Tax=Epibacterium sp. Ofav1-8 TaxID=2917735 RepID=UPI001EF473C2|nr:HAD family acid phosphatase [Epibacterium sp. Ofav1-8]MCG7624647.1 polynucleotide kinase [Epibacterium sp. Ofav1-8]